MKSQKYLWKTPKELYNATNDEWVVVVDDDFMINYSYFSVVNYNNQVWAFGGKYEKIDGMGQKIHLCQM